MRKRLYKEHRKMFCRVISALLVLSVLIFSVFFYLMFESEKSQLIKNAENNFNVLTSNLKNASFADKSFADFLLNSGRAKNSEIIITDSNGDEFAKSENKLALDFYDNDYESVMGFVSFENFRSSATDEQYKKITDLLSNRSDGISEYLLLMTEFYISSDGKEIYPKKVEIIPSMLKGSDYNAENTVEEFYLAPKDIQNCKLKKSGKKCDSIILSDFVCGGYSTGNLIHTAKDIIKNQPAEISEKAVKENLFTYIYLDSENISDNSLTVTYAEQINVLDDCYERILLMLIYISALLIISAPIIWIISRRNVTRQLYLEKERKSVTSAIAHDIKTPLFIIGGNAETMLELSDNEAQNECAKNILDCSDSANRLIENMLELSRLDSDSYLLNKENISLNETLNKTINRYCAEITIEQNENINIFADRLLVERMLSNLIDNAIKYTDDKSSIKIALCKNNLLISNHCNGIDNNDLTEIFEPYRRLANKSGSGLGLSIVKSICELHNFGYCAYIKNSRITFRIEF